MNIIIKNRFLLYKGYKFKCSIGKSGIKKNKREGDNATPQGIFSLGKFYYRPDRIKKVCTNLSYKKITHSLKIFCYIRSKNSRFFLVKIQIIISSFFTILYHFYQENKYTLFWNMFAIFYYMRTWKEKK